MSADSRDIADNELACKALTSCQRALLGAISGNVRAVSIQWSGSSLLSIRVHYYDTPSEDEVEDMEVVTTEMYADDFFETIGPVERIVSDAPLHELQFLGRLVFLRKE